MNYMGESPETCKNTFPNSLNKNKKQQEEKFALRKLCLHTSLTIQKFGWQVTYAHLTKNIVNYQQKFF